MTAEAYRAGALKEFASIGFTKLSIVNGLQRTSMLLVFYPQFRWNGNLVFQICIPSTLGSLHGPSCLPHCVIF